MIYISERGAADMNRTGRKPIGNGFLGMVVLIIFIAGIATMLVSGHNLNVQNSKPEEVPSDTVSTPTSDSTAGLPSDVINPNAFEEESNLPDDITLISMLNDDIHKGPLILVNYQYESKIDGESLVNLFENASSSYTVKNDDMYINNVLIDHMNSLFDDFQSAKGGSGIFVSSSYRSKADQEDIYNDSVESTGEKSTAYYVAVPGYSEHQTGYCFDTATVDYNGDVTELDGEGIYSWLSDNCADYGFILRYPEDKTNITGIGYESWHFRYVGAPHSYFIKDKGICLEEYIAGIQSYTYEDGGLLIDKGDKGKWVVYYVPKLEAFNTTEIPVPKDCDYTVSGNNINGFIVTADVTKNSKSSLLKNAKSAWKYDSKELIIDGFEDYVPGESDEDSDTDETEGWESDSFWDEEEDSDFEYIDYYDDYDDSYSDYGYDESYDYTESADYQ